MVPADSCRISRVPHYSGAASGGSEFSVTGLSPSSGTFSKRLLLTLCCPFTDGPTTPADALPHRRFGLLRVRSPLLAQSLLFSLPPGTEMFQFPGLAPEICSGAGRLSLRVAPFGNPRFTGYLLLCAAYRSLSRPSSPPRAKASFMCPFLLSFFLFKESRL